MKMKTCQDAGKEDTRVSGQSFVSAAIRQHFLAFNTHYMRTICLLICSNVFMTFAWYWHLKEKGIPLWKAILISWGIAFFEYCLTVPANRMGFASGFNGFQLKIIQEVITLVIFTIFAILYLKEPFHWKYLVSFAFIMGAGYVAWKK